MKEKQPCCYAAIQLYKGGVVNLAAYYGGVSPILVCQLQEGHEGEHVWGSSLEGGE